VRPRDETRRTGCASTARLRPRVSAASEDPSSPGEADPIVVRGEQAVQDMVGQILLPSRTQPVIAVALSARAGQLNRATDGIRAVVGPAARIYAVSGSRPLKVLERELGRTLALAPDCARVWWPGLTLCSNPFDHPLVAFLDAQSTAGAMEEFARQFDLSRPSVRFQLELIEYDTVLLNRQLALAREQLAHSEEGLRDAKIERHREEARAAAAEARLREVLRQHEIL
jgi:hypothetical protein